MHTSENAADMLTKPVTATKFKHCLDLVNVSSLWQPLGAKVAAIKDFVREAWPIQAKVEICWVGG